MGSSREMIGSIIVLIAIYWLRYYISKVVKHEKIFNVYSQPGKWFYLKYIICYCLLLIRRLKTIFNRVSEADLEKLKPLSTHDKAFDAVFFQAVSQDGFYFCGGIERRHQAKSNGLFYILIPKLGLLESMKLPNTLLDSDPASVLLNHEFGAEGICFKPLESMKKWRVSFSGAMQISGETKREVYVQLEGEWTTDLPYFLFERDMHLKTLANAIAREEWNTTFFKSLKSAHQTHYEQMGYFQGTLLVDNRECILKMDAFRDHSFGHKRDWALMHRYIFHMLFLEDGTRVSFGKVSQPCTTSSLGMGYILLPDKSIHPIEDSDLELYQHAEKGNPPANYSFTFKAARKFHTVKVKVIKEAFHYKGNDREAKLIERFIECSVDGVQGRGVSEWHYNNL